MLLWSNQNQHLAKRCPNFPHSWRWGFPWLEFEFLPCPGHNLKDYILVGFANNHNHLEFCLIDSSYSSGLECLSKWSRRRNERFATIALNVIGFVLICFRLSSWRDSIFNRIMWHRLVHKTVASSRNNYYMFTFNTYTCQYLADLRSLKSWMI